MILKNFIKNIVDKNYCKAKKICNFVYCHESNYKE